MKNFFISIELYEISRVIVSKIQRPRQTYFCLQVNKVRARFTSFVSLISVEMTCWEYFFSKFYDVNYFVLYATFNKVMAGFITLTLQSRWCVRSIPLQSSMTWIILFYTQCFKYYVMGFLFVSIIFIKIIWILFTFNV